MENKKLKTLSLFSGIGAFEKALSNLNIDYELINYCEINTYASKAYSLIHNVMEDKNLFDVKKINPKTLPDFDLLTWGFPCTNVSVAGKKEGLILKCNDCHETFEYNSYSLFDKLESNEICPKCKSVNVNAHNQSGLYYEGYKILYHKRPKISIIENVKRLISTPSFNLILKDLESLGYTNYYKVLNAKDYGIPQNRERVFIVSVLNDTNKSFEFMKPFDAGIRLNHIMEKNADEKYFISTALSEPFIKKNALKYLLNSNSCSIKTLGLLNFKAMESCRRVYDDKGLSPTLTTMQGGNRQPKILFFENKLNFINGFEDKKMWLENNKSFSRNFRQGERIYDNRYIATSITANGGGTGRNTGLYLGAISTSPNKYRKYKLLKQSNLKHKKYTLSNNGFFIRRLTPKECFLLMGFSTEDFNKLIEFSDTQLYKMAGNSIVVNVLEKIFHELYLK